MIDNYIWKTPGFWAGVQEYLGAIRAYHNLSTKDVHTRLKEIQAAIGGEIQQPRALHNAYIGETIPRSKAACTVIFRWAEEFAAVHACSDLCDDERHDRFLQLATSVNLAFRRHRNEAPGKSEVRASLSLVTSMLNLSDADLHKLEKSIFRDTDRVNEKGRYERHFLCYRFSSESGRVARSFLSIFGRDSTVPGVCRFANFFQDINGSSRSSHGILLPFPLGIYFLGQSEGKAMKLMTVRNLPKQRKTHGGLLLSSDVGVGALAARVVLVDTQLRHSAGANVGVFTEEELRDDPHFHRNLLIRKGDVPPATPIVMCA